MNKQELLKEFRMKCDVIFDEAITKHDTKQQRASYINREIRKIQEKYIDLQLNSNSSINITTEQLSNILLITYISIIMMLEYRNKAWPYEYMTFSRRIGELWEEFCNIPFEYAIEDLNLYRPPLYDTIANEVREEFSEYISTLNLDNNQSNKIFDFFEMQSNLINSGSINMKLDVHFEKDNEYYNVDLKSGFSSNEKGNVNRLLMVASIYNSLDTKNNMILLVRQPKEENNHYLSTIEKSKLWEVYCADDAYNKISELTGINLRLWMEEFMDWEYDIDSDFRKFLIDTDLINYLTW